MMKLTITATDHHADTDEAAISRAAMKLVVRGRLNQVQPGTGRIASNTQVVDVGH